MLVCAEGQCNQTVARKLRCSLGMVGKWRTRFLKARLEGLYDEPRTGAPRSFAQTVGAGPVRIQTGAEGRPAN